MAAVVRLAQPRDAFAVAALTLQDDRERGAVGQPGFLDRFADAWLADRDRVTFLAEAGDGRPLGTVTAALVSTLPSSRRPDDRWLHVSLLFVTQDARGAGLGTALLAGLHDWARAKGVARIQLPAVAGPGSLCARAGYGPPSEALLEWRADDAR